MITRYVYHWPKQVYIKVTSWRLQHYIGSSQSLFIKSVKQTESAQPRIVAKAQCLAHSGDNAHLDIFTARLAGGRNLAYFADWWRYRDGYVLQDLYSPVQQPLWVDDDETRRNWNDNGTSRPWAFPVPSLVSNVDEGDGSAVASGFPPSTKVFNRGSEIGIGNYVYRATNSPVSDASGVIKVDIAPRAQENHAAGSQIIHGMSGLFALVDYDQEDRDVTDSYSRTFTFIQVREEELIETELVYENPNA